MDLLQRTTVAFLLFVAVNFILHWVGLKQRKPFYLLQLILVSICLGLVVLVLSLLEFNKASEVTRFSVGSLMLFCPAQVFYTALSLRKYLKTNDLTSPGLWFLSAFLFMLGVAFVILLLLAIAMTGMNSFRMIG